MWAGSSIRNIYPGLSHCAAQVIGQTLTQGSEFIARPGESEKRQPSVASSAIALLSWIAAGSSVVCAEGAATSAESVTVKIQKITYWADRVLLG